MLLVDPQTRFVVGNQADAESRLTENQGLFVGKLPEQESIANTAYKWAGVTWTMLMWPLPTNRYARGRLLMHESFHRIQDQLGLPGANPLNNHLDTQEGRSWLRLEWRALNEALIRSGNRRQSAVVDALVFRAYRRSFFKEAADQERALELNEGIAEYTGYRLSGWPEEILPGRAAVRLEQEERGTNFVRSFAYASGPAWGILLDHVAGPWRKALNRESDLGAILAKAMGITVPGELAAEANRRAAQYDGGGVIAEEATRAQARQQAVARNRARFLDSPVLILPLGDSMRYTFDPQTAEALGEVGTVYLTSRLTSDWGVLEVTKGVLLSRDQAGRMTDARVPAPSSPGGPSVSGDGWTLNLNEGWKLVAGQRAGDYALAKVN